jgi:hypothetical protein
MISLKSIIDASGEFGGRGRAIAPYHTRDGFPVELPDAPQTGILDGTCFHSEFRFAVIVSNKQGREEAGF